MIKAPSPVVQRKQMNDKRWKSSAPELKNVKYKVPPASGDGEPLKRFTAESD